MEYNDKKIVVAGASGGIGSAICKALAHEGASVIMLGRNTEKLEQQMASMEGGGHAFYACDLAQVETIEATVKKIIEEQGPVDGLVHSAGVGDVRPLKLSKYPFMLGVMNVNFFSFIEMARCLTRKGTFNRGMSIVGISSIGAQYGRATREAYAASKGAMDSAMRCMAIELHNKGVRVNCVAPGSVGTEMTQAYDDYAGDTDEYRLNAYRQYLGKCLPEDVANAVLFLLGERARMITGTIINVDGGKMSA